MRITLRIMGLDVFDLDVTTDAPPSDESLGDVTTYPIGFTAPPLAPLDVDMPDRE